MDASLTPKPPVGKRILLTHPPYEATVTAHTECGFTYRGNPSSFIPRWGMSFTGEGEIFTDVLGWDRQILTSADLDDRDTPIYPHGQIHTD